MTTRLWSAPEVVPNLTYSDVARAAEWIERVFGFRERSDARLSWPGGSIAWFEVGRSLFSISTPDLGWPETDTSPSTSTVKVYVADLESHFEHARLEGATIVAAPEDGFWGGRTYRAVDLAGHRWEISQAGRDLSADQWRLPPDVVRGRW
jgi:uncharacterized glyoxalase superfamily protein PhnB